MSQYLEALRQAMVIYPMIVVLFTVPYIAWSYHKYGSVLSGSWSCTVSFCTFSVSTALSFYRCLRRKRLPLCMDIRRSLSRFLFLPI